MTHSCVRLDLALRLVAEEVEGAGLGDIVAAVRVGGEAGGVTAMA